jgi:hypothetical protein
MIYIITPTFDRVDSTIKFLNSIKESTDKEYLVLIIDDHPGKPTFKAIKKDKSVRVITSCKELWWVGSINLGINILLHEYGLTDEDVVIFANNDVQIDRQSFNLLYQELNNNSNQIVHPRTFNQNGDEVSSGTKILSYFPYITIHPMNFCNKKEAIDMGTGRFLMMSGNVLKKVGRINPSLVQYLGDNDFTLSAKKFYKIKSFILRDATCRLDDTNTGMKSNNIQNINELFSSFFSVKSPNNLKYRYLFFKKYFNPIGALFITLSMTLNSVVKFIYYRVGGK